MVTTKKLSDLPMTDEMRLFKEEFYLLYARQRNMPIWTKRPKMRKKKKGKIFHSFAPTINAGCGYGAEDSGRVGDESVHALQEKSLVSIRCLDTKEQIISIDDAYLKPLPPVAISVPGICSCQCTSLTDSM